MPCRLRCKMHNLQRSVELFARLVDKPGASVLLPILAQIRAFMPDDLAGCRQPRFAVPQWGALTGSTSVGQPKTTIPGMSSVA